MILQPSAEALERAGDTIRRGGMVAFPTETVYGLGANALDTDAVERIYPSEGAAVCKSADRACRGRSDG